MNAADILYWCAENDVRLATCGERLRWNAPKGTVSGPIVNAFRQHKPELLERLRNDPVESTALDYATSKTGMGGSQPEIRVPAWVRGKALERLPEVVQGLVCEREGWTPRSWAEYLCYKARACRNLHPDLADRYDEAARRLWHGG